MRYQSNDCCEYSRGGIIRERNRNTRCHGGRQDDEGQDDSDAGGGRQDDEGQDDEGQDDSDAGGGWQDDRRPAGDGRMIRGRWVMAG
ncbi:MAG: hypothetical protein R3E01_00730 [Pirellulaceae bacterium]